MHGSALAEALEKVGDRWTLLVVEALLVGPRRWSELLGEIPGIAQNVLADRLRRLEREALVVATPYSERPPRMVYRLTGPGRELGGAVRMLADWGAGRSPAAQPVSHEVCGTPVEARWFCPTCARPVDEAEANDATYV
jgi:DNA-binding HxlR family transcriptional regulator